MLKAERLLQTKFFLGIMTLLQAQWYIGRLALDKELNLHIVPLLLGLTLFLGLTISFMPTHSVSWIRQTTAHLIQNEKFLILTLCVIFLAISVIYIKHSSWGYDERDIFVASRVVAENGISEFFDHYGEIKWLGTQHPPLSPLVIGLFMHVWGVNALAFHLVGLFFAFPTVLLTYFISRELTDRTTGFLAALLLLSFPRFLQIVFQVTNDIFIAFFFTMVLFLIIRISHTPRYWLSILTGLVAGAGLLSKYTMVFLYLMLPRLLYSPLRLQKNWPDEQLPLKFQRKNEVNACIWLKQLGIISLISIGILATWLIYANHIGVFAKQEQQIIYYVGVTPDWQGVPKLLGLWRMKARLDMLAVRAPSALGLYNMPMLVLGGILVLRRRTDSDKFILLWIAAVSLPVILLLPVDRYLVPAFPAFAMIMAHSRFYLSSAMKPAVILALLYSISTIYLYLY
jgi:hypothetical protein